MHLRPVTSPRTLPSVLRFGVSLVLLAILSAPASAVVIWDIVQLTDNSNNNGNSSMAHKIDGDIVAWQGTSNRDVFFYDGSSTTNIHNTAATFETNPHVSSQTIVWGNANTGAYNISTALTKPVTGGSFGTKTSLDKYVVWRYPTPQTGNYYQIFGYDLDTSTQFNVATSNSTYRDDPEISGAFVAYRNALTGANDGIHLFDIVANQTTNLSAIAGTVAANDFNFRISENNVVWQGSTDGADSEIFLYKGGSGTVTQITNNATTDSLPYISGDQVVWQGTDGDNEIFLYDIPSATTKKISNNSFHDFAPRISNGNVAWYGQTGGTAASSEIFVYVGANDEIIQLTSNSTADQNPEISGLDIVWERRRTSSSASALDLFLAQYQSGVVPEPGTFVLLGLGALVLLPAMRRRTRARV